MVVSKEFWKSREEKMKLNILSNEEQNTRLGICVKCDSYHNNICSQCNCKVDVKIQFRQVSCPVNKW